MCSNKDSMSFWSSHFYLFYNRIGKVCKGSTQPKMNLRINWYEEISQVKWFHPWTHKPRSQCDCIVSFKTRGDILDEYVRKQNRKKVINWTLQAWDIPKRFHYQSTLTLICLHYSFCIVQHALVSDHHLTPPDLLYIDLLRL